jgi:hypothetical protein
MTDRYHQRSIRRGILRNRFLRRLRSVFTAGMLLVTLALVVLSGHAVSRAFYHQNLYRVSIQDNRHLLIEKGRCLPWLEFVPADPDLPVLRPGEVSSITQNMVASGDENNPQIFSDHTVLKSYLALLYRHAAVTIPKNSLSNVSRSVTLLETAFILDPVHVPSELIDALIALSDRFSSREGGENLMEAWRNLRRAADLLTEYDTHSSVDLVKFHETAVSKSKRLSGRLERKWFHRVREHLNDGNLKAAAVIVADLENAGFERQELRDFRTRLERLEESLQ